MPGHKGEIPHDITEIYGADNLYESDITNGIIGTSEMFAARIFGAAKTCYSCEGSTLAIHTALAILKSRGCNTIAASRYSHRALGHAATLLHINIKWLYPEEYLSANVKYDAEAIRGADALFITNVDYYGGTWKFVNPKIPVIIDNAHGAYLRFVDKRRFGREYLHPMELGYPLMSVESAHKTLPVLTGGGYLHFANGADFSRAKEFMEMFGTASPSYLILESLDRFNGMIVENPQMVNNACETVANLKETLTKMGVPLKKSDPLRVTINARECGMSGYEFAAQLRGNGVECEMADQNYVVLMFSGISTYEDCERAEMAISFIAMMPPKPLAQFPHIKPKVALPMWEAVWKPCRSIPLEQAKGEVCGAMKSPCPPGVPIVFPGEVIDEDAIAVMKMHGVKSVSVIATKE